MCRPVPTPAQPQLTFIRNFLEPTLQACRPLAPRFVEMALNGMAAAQRAWETILEEDREAAAAASGDAGAAPAE